MGFGGRQVSSSFGQGDAMNKALLATAACAALGLASMAQAAITASLTQQTTTLTSMPGYIGYKLTLTSDQGPISAIDFGGVDAAKPNEALKGLFGKFSQRTTIDADTGDRASTPSGNVGTQTAATSRDSLWNNAWATTGEIYGRNEDNDNVNDPTGVNGNPVADTATSDWGIGHAMHFATGVNAAAQSSTLDIAYLVMKATDTVHVMGEVQGGTGGKTVIDQVLPVPEPMSAGLLGLGALGLFARRRRS
jgi:hypothetical protein